MVSYSSCCLVIALIETQGFWISCSLNNPRARAVEHPITDASQLQPGIKVRPQNCLAEVVVLLWRKLCFVCSCLALARLHNCTFLFYFKASWGIQNPLPLTAAKAIECHVSNEPCGLSDGLTETARQGVHTQACTSIHGLPLSTGHHAGLHYETPWVPPGLGRLFSLSQKGTELLPECWACW